MDADKLKQIGDRAQQLGRLKDSEDFQTLRSVCETRFQKEKDRLVTSFFDDQPVNQREVDYFRGVQDTLAYIFNAPDKAETALRNALKRATNLEESEA